jgi:ABC-type antimicrobial peptide transport system permease subunit
LARETKPSEKKALATLPSAQQPAKRALAPDLLSGRPRHGMAGDAIVSSALEALQANRLRSFLTILGVIIGVAAVIAVVTLAQGVSQSISQRLAGLGTNLITISPGTATTTGARSAVGSAQTLTLDDAQALTQVAHVVSMSPLILTSGQVIYGNQNWSTTVRGVYPVYQTMQNWQIAEGSWFSDEAEQTGAPVAVLGQTVVQNLFSASATDPIGQTIRINSQLFRVVGTLQAKGSQGLSNTDDVIFVPFSAANERLKPSPLYVDQIQVQVDDVNNIAQVQQNITTLLRARHHLSGSAPTQGQQGSGANPLRGLGGGTGGFGGGSGSGNPTRGFGGGGTGGFGGGSGNPTRGSGSGGATTPRISFASANVSTPNDFQVFNGNQLVQTAQQSTAALTILLIGIAAISLFVGGIGIMNIMLVSVSERTREIGIRMAIGARQRDIRNQFLLEALLLSITGGVLGILTGFVAGYALTRGFGGFPFVFSPIAVALAFTVSAIVGISFGYYPAVHAAKLDPVIALRME